VERQQFGADWPIKKCWPKHHFPEQYSLIIFLGRRLLAALPSLRLITLDCGHSDSGRLRKVMLKVAGCLPKRACRSSCGRATRAGVRQASREETAGSGDAVMGIGWIA
jgi:hypothetical protein